MQVAGGVKARRGLPVANTADWPSGGTNYSNRGFSFDLDGDTGMFRDIINPIASRRDSPYGYSDLVFMSDAMEILRLQNGTGYVGIGTTDPDAKLDIRGTIKMTGGNPAFNKILTARDSDGNTEWKTLQEVFRKYYLSRGKPFRSHSSASNRVIVLYSI